MLYSFDTNILVHASGTGDPDKQFRARSLIAGAMRTRTSMLLLQTLAEFSNVAVRKYAQPVNKVSALVAAWQSVFDVHPAASTDLAHALAAVDQHRLQFWDAMLWAT